MTMNRHLDDSTLMSFAAGALPEALAVVAAAHVAVCPRCRDELATMEMLGGALLGSLPGAAMRSPAPAAPEIERHSSSRPAAAPPPITQGAAVGEVPAPLARLIGNDLDGLHWRWVAPGSWLRHVPITSGRLHLFKCSSDVALPEHGHEGSEITMVLRGTISDGTGLYRVGEVCDIDENVEHAPVAGTDGCICVVAQDRPARFRSLIVRLTRPWHGM
jgi:putative transcriptional regulator